jgi:hypothetical protein
LPVHDHGTKVDRAEFAAGLIKSAKAARVDLSLAMHKDLNGEWSVVVVDLGFEGGIPRWFSPWAGERMEEFGKLLERLGGRRRSN